MKNFIFVAILSMLSVHGANAQYVNVNGSIGTSTLAPADITADPSGNLARWSGAVGNSYDWYGGIYEKSVSQPEFNSGYFPNAAGTGGTGGVASTTINITMVTNGAFTTGCTLSGPGIAAGTTIQGPGGPAAFGNAGPYELNQAATVPNGSSISCVNSGNYTILGKQMAPGAVIDEAGRLWLGANGWSASPNFQCNYGNGNGSHSMCPATGPLLNVAGDITAGDYIYFGASGPTTLEPVVIGNRLFGSYASSSIFSAGYGGAPSVDTDPTNGCGPLSAACGSAGIIANPDVSFASIRGGLELIGYSSGPSGGGVYIETRSGHNSTAIQWQFSSDGGLFYQGGGYVDKGPGTINAATYYSGPNPGVTGCYGSVRFSGGIAIGPC